MILHYLDVAALWVVWWCSFAGLSGGTEVRSWRTLALSLSLILLMVSSFTGAIALYVEPKLLPPWGRGFIYGTAVVSLWLYDYRFGFVRQARMIRNAACSFWDRLRPRRHA